jgi:hypothetical protein
VILHTSRRARRRAFSLLAAASLLLATSIPAAAWSPDPTLGGPMFRQYQSLLYRWGNADAMPLSLKTAIANSGVDATQTRLSQAPSFAWDAAGSNVVWYGGTVPCSAAGLACFSRNAPTGFTIWVRENGHRFDFGTLRWCEASGDPDGCYEAETVVLDELGHVDDLDHHVNLADNSDYTDAVVQGLTRDKPDPGWNAHAFGRCDVATLQALYDVGSWTTPYSTCSDVPTTLSLVASRTASKAGSMVTFTASLGSRGSGLLGDNPIAGRVVVLEQRSGTSWVDVATMGVALSAGNYFTSVTTWATADYRAVFRKPASEGLRAATSALVTITVTTTCTTGCPLRAEGTR